MVDRIESLGEVHSHRHGAVDRVVLVEAHCNLVDQWVEGCSGGVARTEAMLGVRKVNERGHLGVDESL